MLTTSLLLLLIYNCRYFFNYLSLILTVGIYQTGISLISIETSKLMFNSYSVYDPLTISIIIISSLVAI
jgi:hypothetical protein